SPMTRIASSISAEFPLRLTVMRPPSEVAIQVHRGRSGLLFATRVGEEILSFDFRVRVTGLSLEGRPNFTGEFAQGPRSARFVYVNSGARAGQPSSCRDRRAKVSLMTITSAQVES